MCEPIKEAHKNMGYLIEQNRRNTFRKWIFSNRDACNANKMAEAGFIFIGNKLEPDTVKCFLCNISLDGWDATDDPWSEHIKHSPNCCFAKLQKPQSNLTLQEYLNIAHSLTEKLIESYYDNKAIDTERRFHEYERKIYRLQKPYL